MSEKEREMKIKSIAKEKGLTTKRMPGKGKEKRYRGTIPDKYKGKLMIVDDKKRGHIYDDDGEGIIGDMDDYYAPKIEYYFFPEEEEEPELMSEQELEDFAAAKMREMEGLPSIDPSTNITDEMKIKSIAKGRGLTTKRMPGKGKEKTYFGTIPDEYKGKLMIVENEYYGSIYSDDAEDIIGDMDPEGQDDEGAIKIDYKFWDDDMIKEEMKDRLLDAAMAADEAIAQMRQLKDLPSIDPSTNITDEIDKLLYSYRIRPPPKPNPEQAKAIKNLRDINDIAVKDTSSNLKGDVNELMSLYGIR